LFPSSRRNSNANGEIERTSTLRESPRPVPLLRSGFSVIGIMNQPSPVSRSITLDFDRGNGTNTVRVNDGKSEVVWTTTVSEPEIHVAGDGARNTLVASGDNTSSQGTISLKTTHGDIREIHVVRTSWEWTPVLEVNFTTVIVAGTAAPFVVCVARAGIDDFQGDWGCVTGFPNGVVGSVGFGLDELEALAAGEVVVEVAREVGPELGIVVSVGGGEVTTESGARGIFAKEGICGTEGIAGCTEHGVGPAGCCAAFGAETVESEAACSATGQTKMSGSTVVPIFGAQRGGFSPHGT
jgi:hypothetical protein